MEYLIEQFIVEIDPESNCEIPVAHNHLNAHYVRFSDLDELKDACDSLFGTFVGKIFEMKDGISTNVCIGWKFRQDKLGYEHSAEQRVHVVIYQSCKHGDKNEIVQTIERLEIRTGVKYAEKLI